MLFSMKDEHLIQPVDPRVKEAVRTLERAIIESAVKRLTQATKSGRSIGTQDRIAAASTVQMDRLARVAEYVEHHYVDHPHSHIGSEGPE